MEVCEEGAPCLMRSLSQPFFASCEYKEGDPLRALTTSISFGRFMTEPLDWEKWSSFSHNRTLEDVQKYSRPGAVAEKKAFFEAHYKKVAAKRAAISPKKENKAPNFSSEINVKTDVNPTRSNTHSAIDDTRGNELSTLASNPVFSNTDDCVSSSIHAEQETVSSDVNPTRSNTHSAIDDARENELSTLASDPVFSNNDDCVSSSIQAEQETVSSDVNPTRSNTHSAINEARGNELSTLASNPLFSNTDDCASSSIQAEQETVSSDDVCSPSTGLLVSEVIQVDENASVTNQVEQEKVSTDDVCLPSTNLVLANSGSVDLNMPSAGQVALKKASSGNVLMKDRQLMVNISSQCSHVDKNKKTQIREAASGRNKISGKVKPEISLNKNGVHNLRSPQRAPAPPIHSRKAARDVTDKKRSAPLSLHMSMNHPPVRNNNGTSKAITKPIDRLIQQALTGVSVNGAKKNFEVKPRPEIKRFKPILDCSVNGSRTVVKKALRTNSHSEASDACTKKPKCTTVPSSFSFRSEERAAKRKEFFQKLEEKGNTKEMKKILLRPKLKEKAINDNKKSCRSTGLEAKPSTSETKPNQIIKKVPPTRPCSPKLEGKPTTRLVQDTCCPSPWRSSSKPKNFIEINKKKLSSSMASLPAKKMHDPALMSKK